MSEQKIALTEDELHAYVDNELPAERRGDVEAWLAAHPEAAERVQSWRAMAEALHARYDSVADEAVPKRLEIERLLPKPRTWVYGAIAATLAALIGGGVGWMVRGISTSPSAFQSFTVDALGAHRLYVVEVRHPVEVSGNDRAHLQQWLSKRCGWDVRAPELSANSSRDSERHSNSARCCDSRCGSARSTSSGWPTAWRTFLLLLPFFGWRL